MPKSKKPVLLTAVILLAAAGFILLDRREDSPDAPAQGTDIPAADGLACPEGSGKGPLKAQPGENPAGNPMPPAAGGKPGSGGREIPWLVKGRVLEEKDAPIKDVAVEAWNAEKESWMSSRIKENFIRRTLTDPEGRFSMEFDPITSMTLVFISGNHGRLYAAAEAEENPEERVYRLRKGFSAEGTVFDPFGKPVPGALVFAIDREMGYWDEVVKRESITGDMPSRLSDEAGRFLLSPLDPSSGFRLYALDSNGFLGKGDCEVVFDGDNPDLPVRCDVVIRGRGKLVVRVTGMREDASGCECPITAFRKNPDRDDWEEVCTQCRSEDGTAVFTNLAAGTYKVVSWPWNHAPFEGTAEVVDMGTSSMEIAIKEGLELSGVVLNRAGQPVNDARIWIKMVGAAFPLSFASQDCNTHSDGSFKIGGMPEGPLALTVGSEQYVPTRFDGVKACTTLQLVIARLPLVSGTVRPALASAALPATLKLRMYDENYCFEASAKTGEDGGFQASVPLPFHDMQVEEALKFERRCRCIGCVEDSALLDFGECMLKPDQTFVLRAPVLIPDRTVAGSVSDPSGRPVDAAEIELWIEGNICFRTKSRDNGSFVIENVPQLPARLFVQHDLHPAEFRKLSKDETRVDVRLFAGSSISGTVMDADGRLIAEMEVFLRWSQRDREYLNPRAIIAEPETGMLGRFLYRKLRPGIYSLRVVAGGRVKEMEIEISDAEDKRIEVVMGSR